MTAVNWFLLCVTPFTTSCFSTILFQNKPFFFSKIRTWRLPVVRARFLRAKYSHDNNALMWPFLRTVYLYVLVEVCTNITPIFVITRGLGAQICSLVPISLWYGTRKGNAHLLSFGFEKLPTSKERKVCFGFDLSSPWVTQTLNQKLHFLVHSSQL